jgi:ribonuclease D
VNVDLVNTAEALAILCERIVAAPRIALDTEFHTEKHFTPKLMVVQVAFDDAVAIVDPLALPDLRPLADALTQAKVVGHALSSDLRILEDAFGTLPRGAYDTQVAAAFCGYGMSISLLDLVRDVAGVTLQKSQTVSDWSTRPFTPKQLDYLVDDVRYLFAIADRLDRNLSERGRLSWALEEMRTLVDPKTYRSDKRRLYLRVAGNARMNRRELGVLNELALLRETIARERNIPLKYVLPDDVLVGLVGLRPSTIEELSQLRRLDAGMRKHIGTRILAAVAAGRAAAAGAAAAWGPARRPRGRHRPPYQRRRGGQRLAGGAAGLARRDRADRARPAAVAGGALGASELDPLAARPGRRAALGLPLRGTGPTDQQLSRWAAQDDVGNPARGEPGVGVAPTPSGEGRSM